MERFIRIRSWHIIRTPTRMPDTYVTLCGKRATGKPARDFSNEKTCETCMRIDVARRQATG